MSLSISPAEAAQEILRRDAAAESLIDFVCYTKPDYIVGWFHAQLAEAIEALLAGDIPNLMVEAPPQHGKTELTTRRLPAYIIGKWPDARVITATYNAEWAGDLGRDVRDIVSSQDYVNVFPGVTLRPDSKAAYRWQTSTGGFYIAAGVGTSLTGRTGTIGIIDDPFKDSEEADSELRREKVWRWYTKVFRSRLTKDAPKLVINTRWHEDDLSGRILEKAQTSGEEWHQIRFPAILDEGTDDERALFPEKKPLEWLKMERGTMSKRDWMALYQQNPTPDDGDYFRRHWFRTYRDPPKREQCNVYVTGDFAATPDGGDFTEFGVWAVDPYDRIYALDWYAGRVSSLEWVQRLIELFRIYRPNYFVGEQGPLRRAMEPVIRHEMRHTRNYVPLDWLPTTSDKTTHARAFQKIAENGLIYFPETDWAERVLSQLLKFPAGKWDDAVDVCSLFGRFIDKTWAGKLPPKKKQPPTILEPDEHRISDLEPDDDFSRMMRYG